MNLQKNAWKKDLKSKFTMEGKIMKNELYVVKDAPRYSENVSNYCYVVKAASYDEAIEIVKRKTGHNWKWQASLADNDEIWQ